MKEEVSHRGRVLSADAEKIRVEIISSSACTSCHAAGLCSMSEAVKKIVDVPAFGNSGYAPGDEVELVLTASMGMKAVLAAYAVPLVILLAICVSMSYAGVHEVYAGLAGLAGVAVWYLVLYFMRNRISKDYVFRIRKDYNLNS